MPPLKGHSMPIAWGFVGVFVVCESGEKYRRRKRCVRKVASLVQARANPANQSGAAWESEGKKDHHGRGGTVESLSIIPSCTRIKKPCVKLVGDRLKPNPVNFSFVIIQKIIGWWVPVGSWECQSLADGWNTWRAVFIWRGDLSELHMKVTWRRAGARCVWCYPVHSHVVSTCARAGRQMNY